MGQVGEHFHLNSPCMGTLIQDGKKIVFQIPAGSHIFAIDPIPKEVSKDLLRRVNIQWQGRTMTMFLTDLQEPGGTYSSCSRAVAVFQNDACSQTLTELWQVLNKAH